MTRRRAGARRRRPRLPRSAGGRRRRAARRAGGEELDPPRFRRPRNRPRRGGLRRRLDLARVLRHAPARLHFALWSLVLLRLVLPPGLGGAVERPRAGRPLAGPAHRRRRAGCLPPDRPRRLTVERAPRRSDPRRGAGGAGTLDGRPRRRLAGRCRDPRRPLLHPAPPLPASRRLCPPGGRPAADRRRRSLASPAAHPPAGRAETVRGRTHAVHPRRLPAADRPSPSAGRRRRPARGRPSRRGHRPRDGPCSPPRRPLARPSERDPDRLVLEPPGLVDRRPAQRRPRADRRRRRAGLAAHRPPRLRREPARGAPARPRGAGRPGRRARPRQPQEENRHAPPRHPASPARSSVARPAGRPGPGFRPWRSRIAADGERFHRRRAGRPEAGRCARGRRRRRARPRGDRGPRPSPGRPAGHADAGGGAGSRSGHAQRGRPSLRPHSRRQRWPR